MKKRDLLVTLLYFLDTVVLMVSVMFSVWIRNEFQLSALTKELNRGSFWTSMVLLAVVYACAFTLSRTYQVLWEYASLRDVCIVSVCAMGSSIVFALMRTVLKFPYFAPSVYYGYPAFGRRSCGNKNGTQNIEAQAVEGNNAEIKQK